MEMASHQPFQKDLKKHNKLSTNSAPCSPQKAHTPSMERLNSESPACIKQPATNLNSSSSLTDAFHVIHKVPVGDSPYVRAKHVQLVDKDPDRAIALFWSAINSGDRVDSALKDMAIVMKQQNRAEEAIEAIKSLRVRCSDSSQESLDNVLLDLYKRCGRLDDQIALLKHKLDMIQQGMAFNGKRTKTARSQGKKFQVSIEQEATRLLGNLGWAYMQQNNYIAAEAVYRKALSLESDNNKVCNLGICLMKQGRLSEAKAMLIAAAPAAAPTKGSAAAASNAMGDTSSSRWGSESHVKSFERAQEMLKEVEASMAAQQQQKYSGGSTGVGFNKWESSSSARNSEGSNTTEVEAAAEAVDCSSLYSCHEQLPQQQQPEEVNTVEAVKKSNGSCFETRRIHKVYDRSSSNSSENSRSSSSSRVGEKTSNKSRKGAAARPQLLKSVQPLGALNADPPHTSFHKDRLAVLPSMHVQGPSQLPPLPVDDDLHAHARLTLAEVAEQYSSAILNQQQPYMSSQHNRVTTPPTMDDFYVFSPDAVDIAGTPSVLLPPAHYQQQHQSLQYGERGMGHHPSLAAMHQHQKQQQLQAPQVDISWHAELLRMRLAAVQQQQEEQDKQNFRHKFHGMDNSSFSNFAHDTDRIKVGAQWDSSASYHSCHPYVSSFIPPPPAPPLPFLHQQIAPTEFPNKSSIATSYLRPQAKPFTVPHTAGAGEGVGRPTQPLGLSLNNSQPAAFGLNNSNLVPHFDHVAKKDAGENSNSALNVSGSQKRNRVPTPVKDKNSPYNERNLYSGDMGGQPTATVRLLEFETEAAGVDTPEINNNPGLSTNMLPKLMTFATEVPFLPSSHLQGCGNGNSFGLTANLEVKRQRRLRIFQEMTTQCPAT